MRIDEACRELGVALDAEPAVVRRAYLRLLKTRKPEVDPEGFARLRDAYESLTAARDGAEVPRTQSETAPAPAAPQAVPDAPALTAEQRLDSFRARFTMGLA